MPFVS